MKRFKFLLGGGVLVAWGIASIMVGCGSDEAAVADADAGDDSSTSIPGNGEDSGGNNNNNNNNNGDGGSRDGGDGGGGGGGGASNPGKVTCGTSTCDAGGGGGGGGALCCVRNFLDGGSAQACENNCNGIGSIDLRCDEKADCPNANDKCCLGFQGARCDNNCGAGPQLCKLNVECGDAGCAERTCTIGPISRKLMICGKPPTCN